MHIRILLVVSFLASGQLGRAQACSLGPDAVCLCASFPVDSVTALYKTAPRIDELDIPQPEDLYVRLYYPTGLPDTVEVPLLVLVHGGGFIQGNYADYFSIARSIAGRGYAVASVQYRLCQRNDCLFATALPVPGVCNVSWGFSLFPSIYVAAVDVADAIRYLQSRAEEFQFSPTHIVVGGHSAGAWTALNVAFGDLDEFQAACVGCGNGGSDYLGQVYEPPTGIVAAFPFSGALLDTTWIDPGEAASTAVLLAHGNHDEVVPYTSGSAYCCVCAPFSTPTPTIYGSAAVARRLHSLDGSYYLLTGQGCGHEITNSGFDAVALGQLGAFLAKTQRDGELVQKHSVHPCAAVTGCGPLPLPAACISPVSTLPVTPPYIVQTECNCPDLAPCFVEVTAAPEIADIWRVYPNPAHDVLVLENDGWQTAQAALYDFSGKVVRVFGTIGTGQTQLALAGLPGGLYILTLNGERGIRWRMRVAVGQ